jgi:hypothetical protein
MVVRGSLADLSRILSGRPLRSCFPLECWNSSPDGSLLPPDYALHGAPHRPGPAPGRPQVSGHRAALLLQRLPLPGAAPAAHPSYTQAASNCNNAYSNGGLRWLIVRKGPPPGHPCRHAPAPLVPCRAATAGPAQPPAFRGCPPTINRSPRIFVCRTRAGGAPAVAAMLSVLGDDDERYEPPPGGLRLRHPVRRPARPALFGPPHPAQLRTSECLPSSSLSTSRLSAPPMRIGAACARADQGPTSGLTARAHLAHS